MAAAPSLFPDQGITALGLVAPPEIHIDCEAFVGSLATLFQCVRDRKVDLLGVPIAPICEAYLHYLLGMSLDDLDASASALAALAYLLERKAWLLLPVPEEEPVEPEFSEPIEPTVQEYWPAIHFLNGKFQEREQLFFRPSGADLQYELPFEPEEVSSSDLARAFDSLMRKARPDPPQSLSRPRRSLSEQMILVLQALSSDFQTLEAIVQDPLTRSEAVWWFLALLELIRLSQAEVRLAGGEVEFRLRVERGS